MSACSELVDLIQDEYVDDYGVEDQEDNGDRHGPCGMPPPPMFDYDRLGECPASRSDKVYEVERCVKREQREIKRQLNLEQKNSRKKKGRGPTRAHIPPSRECKFVKTAQSGEVKESIKSAIEQEDLDVFSKLPMVHLTDSKSKVQRTIDMNHRSTGIMTRAPSFLNSNNESFPEKWDFNCHWCAHPFKNKPVGYPNKYKKLHEVFYLTGIFCSYNCARAWGHVNTPSHCKHRMNIIMIKMIKEHLKSKGEILNIKSSQFNPAPHYCCLKSFGGSVSIEDFRANHCRQIRLESYPQSMHIVPMGFNVFELPTDTTKLFAQVRPPKYRKTLGDVKEQKKKSHRRKYPINGSDRAVIAVKRTYKSTVKWKKDCRSMKKRQRELAKEVFKMKRPTQNTSKSIQNMMGIKTS
jgi:hypothetical protein